MDPEWMNGSKLHLEPTFSCSWMSCVFVKCCRSSFQSQPGFTCWLPSHCCGQMPERIDFYRRSFVLAHRFQGLGLLMVGPVLRVYDQSSPLWLENLGPYGGQQEREEQGKETVNTSTVRTCA